MRLTTSDHRDEGYLGWVVVLAAVGFVATRLWAFAHGDVMAGVELLTISAVVGCIVLSLKLLRGRGTDG